MKRFSLFTCFFFLQFHFNIQAENGAGSLSNIICNNEPKTDTTYAVIGIKEFITKESYSVYANPLSDEINIQLTAPISTDIKIRLTDVLGRGILNIKMEAGYVRKTLNISQLAQGIYWVQLENGKEIFSTQLIKE